MIRILTSSPLLFRTFRKDRRTFKGKVTLAVLVKVFQKHGYEITDEVAAEISARYRLEPAQAAKILQELHRKEASEGAIGSKVQPTKGASNKQSSYTQQQQQQAGAGKSFQKLSTISRRNSSLT